MGIFSGIEVLFFSLGVISTLLTIGIIKLHKENNFKWYTWLSSVTGAFLVVFTIAWSVSSVLEGEIQAANMGLIMFGLPSLILFGLTRKILTKKSE